MKISVTLDSAFSDKLLLMALAFRFENPKSLNSINVDI